MKNYEEFRASVYVRAEARVQQRKQRIRSVTVSAVTLLVIAAIAVPMIRSGRLFAPPEATLEIVMDGQRQPEVMRAGEAKASKMVLLVAGGSGAEVVVLDSNEKQKAFVSKYKEANNIGEEEGLPMTPANDAATLHSTDELTEWLRDLADTYGAMQQVVDDYDEEFFNENNLCAMPMDLSSPEAEERLNEEESTAAAVLVTIPDYADGDAVTECEETTEAAPDDDLSLQASNVRVLLLVPMGKG